MMNAQEQIAALRNAAATILEVTTTLYISATHQLSSAAIDLARSAVVHSVEFLIAEIEAQQSKKEGSQNANPR